MTKWLKWLKWLIKQALSPWLKYDLTTKHWIHMYRQTNIHVGCNWNRMSGFVTCLLRMPCLNLPYIPCVCDVTILGGKNTDIQFHRETLRTLVATAGDFFALLVCCIGPQPDQKETLGVEYIHRVVLFLHSFMCFVFVVRRYKSMFWITNFVSRTQTNRHI